MFQIFVITLREGIEAFLIVAITVGILRQTGRAALLSAVYWGTGVAVLVSVLASRLFATQATSPFLEGLLAAAASIMVVSMTIYMWRTARSMRANISAQIDHATLNQPSRAAWWGLFTFALLMIVREGMETALLLSFLYLREGLGGSRALFMGGLLGVTGAAALALAWARYGQRINLGRFFQVTAIFLLVFSVQLVIYTFHEFSEAGVVPFVDNAVWHTATEPFGPEGLYGQLLTYCMVLLPTGWLMMVWLKDPRGLRARHG